MARAGKRYFPCKDTRDFAARRHRSGAIVKNVYTSLTKTPMNKSNIRKSLNVLAKLERMTISGGVIFQPPCVKLTDWWKRHSWTDSSTKEPPISDYLSNVISKSQQTCDRVQNRRNNTNAATISSSIGEMRYKYRCNRTQAPLLLKATKQA